jgi:regulator of protease activity HflC (stomatin/prohibitin superfamily)
MKQVAQQEAERAKFVVEQSEQEKLAKIIRAEGDSKVRVWVVVGRKGWFFPRCMVLRA